MTVQSNEFAGLAALVTGGASGIGLATARLLADRGARVAVLDLNQGIEADGDSTDLYPVVADVTDDAAVRAAVAEAGRALGRLDIVVNNAGIGAAGTVEDNDDAEWHRVLDVNVLGIVRTTRAALPLLRQAARERGQAAIVNTCSVAAIAGLQQRALYSATKGAVYSLTLAMAADHVAEGIRVNCVTPGTADTPWVGRLLDAAPDPEAERAALNARQPMGRLVSADEVAAAIAYLASPLAGATTGTALAVDGGMQGLRIRPRPSLIRRASGRRMSEPDVPPRQLERIRQLREADMAIIRDRGMETLASGPDETSFTSPEMSVVIASMFACPGTACSPRPPRRKCCATTARTLDTCGTSRSSSTRTGIQAARARRVTWSSVGSSRGRGPSTSGCARALRWCSSRRCGISPRRWPPSSTRRTRPGGRRGGRRGGMKGSGSSRSSPARCAACPATSARYGCRRLGGCGSAGPARCPGREVLPCDHGPGGTLAYRLRRDP